MTGMIAGPIGTIGGTTIIAAATGTDDWRCASQRSAAQPPISTAPRRSARAGFRAVWL
jgi:hypothetical protein